jgi:cell division protein FtsL
MSLKKIKKKPFYKILFTIIAANFIMHAINMNIQAVKSADFKKYESEITTLKEDVSNLSFKVSSGGSLSQIEAKAKKLGFSNITTEIKIISTSYALKTSNEN